MFSHDWLRIRLAWALVLAAVLGGYGSAAGGDSSTDLAKWQGTWKMVDAICDGGPQTGNVAWVVEGDHYRIRMDGVLHEDLNNIKLDSGRIDVFHHETPRGTFGGKLKGIYQIRADSLTVCYDLTGQRYPKAFEAPRGSRQVVYHFRRE